MRQLIDRLEQNHCLEKEEWTALIAERKDAEYLFARARSLSRQYYGNAVFVRGLIEFTNYCKNNCLYCGIRRENGGVSRYRLSREEILDCCKKGYELGFRTFVLQGGEDAYFDDERLVDLVRSIKAEHPGCAVTLSVGEKSKKSFQKLFDAGADRCLLRHETADAAHYAKLHPKELTLESRMECLWHLKEIGFQVGCGFMVGSPGQTPECLAEDMLFITKLQPQMAGIGPFIPHHQTPFKDEAAGSLELTLYLIGLLRLLKPNLLLPSTTALGTIDKNGREKGILAGANVVMPNLSPAGVRKKYALYDNKICTGEEAAECRQCLNARMERIGYKIVTDRGDPAEEPGGKYVQRNVSQSGRIHQ